MNSTFIFKFSKFSRIAAVAAVMGLGTGGPALALDMICTNVSTMESSIDGTACCQATGILNIWNACGISWNFHCTLADGPLQDCCDATSDTGEQTSCLCGEVAGYSSGQLGFTPEGC